MFKKILYSLVLMAVGFTASSYAQNTLTVYDGEATNAYVPVYGFYCDAFLKAEFVMNSEDLSEMTAGTITGLKWYLSTPATDSWGDANFVIFMKEVSDPTISAYYGMDGATVVYEGPLDGTKEVLKINFTTPYTYEGGHLLIGVYNTVKGSYKSASFAGVNAPGAAVQGYSYSSLDEVSCYQRDFLPKTDFSYQPSGGVVYYKPTHLQATDITPNSATITWTPGADETAWNVEYRVKGTEEWIPAGSVTEPQIALDVLENGTTYEVRVQSDYGEGNLSAWATMTFNTEVCDADDMGEVTYNLTDTYGDGWNGGGKLQIVYHNTGVLVAELVLPQGSGNTELAGELNLCYGEDYDLVWVAGTYNYENGFVLYGPEGEVIYEFQGTGSSSGPVPEPGVLTTFQINRVTCPRPTELAASNIVYNGATLTWTPGTAEQDMWQVAYGVGVFNPNDVEPMTVNEPTAQLTGLEENTTYSAYVRSVCGPEDMSIWSKVCIFSTPLRFPIATDLAIDNITAKSAEAAWNGEAETYNLRYRPKTNLDESFEAEEAPAGWTMNDWVVMPITSYTMGGNPLYAADGNSCMASQSGDFDYYGNFVNYDVDNWMISPKVNLGGTLEFYAADLGADYVENYSVYVSLDGTEFTPLSMNISTPAAMNEWGKQEIDLSAYDGQQGYIAFRHHDAAGYYLFIDAVSINGLPEADWVVMEGVTSPVTMEPLQPGTVYEVQVQGIYEDGNSAWCDVVTFATEPADALPINLQVTDVTDQTATATWNGSQDTYNLRYRTAAVLNGLTEDFTGIENGGLPEGWTTIDADGDGYNWAVWVLTLEDGSTQITLSSNSYVNYVGALTPDNWVLTPQRKLGAQVQFDAWGQDPSYAAEVFRVYASLDGENFTPISEDITATGTQTTYTFDLGEFAGQMGYIALRHYNVTDQYILNVTNFYMAGEEDDVPAGEWIVVENVTAPYTIEGLTPETTYEVEVQGIVEDGTVTDWTAPVEFTTTKAGEQPTEMCARPECGYAITDFETVTVTITNNEPGATVVYEVYCEGELIESGEFTGDQYAFTVTGPGSYVVHAVATMQGMLDSPDGGVFFVILPNDTPPVGIDELTNGKQIANVRYFNSLGQEMQEVNGVTIVVTTYTDGTTSTAKVLK